MNEITTQQMQLPDTLEDLSKFVLVGREKLNAVRAEIRAIEKVQLAAEVHEQKLQEAQEIAEAVLDAEMKLGELTAKMEKAVNQHSVNRNGAKSKREQLAEIGLNKDSTSRYETLASHPEQVEKAKADARAEGKIVTRQDVFHKIAVECYPNKTQEAARELREAKKRHEEYSESKADGIVSFSEAKQDKEDSKLISEAFCKYFYDKGYGIDLISVEIKNKGLDYLLSGATERDIYELENHLRRWQKNIIHIQKLLAERRINGK